LAVVARTLRSARGWAWAGASLYTLTVISVTVLGAVLRFYCLDCHSLWRDEIYGIEQARLVTGVEYFTGRLFLATLQTWLTIQAIDPAQTSLVVRLPSATAGSFLAPVVYGIGRELFGRKQGLLAALFVACSVPLLDHSQEARTYGLIPLLCALSVYCLLRFERTPSWGWAAGFLASMSINLVYSNTVLFVIVPTLLPLIAWTLWRVGARRLPRRALTVGVGLAMLGVGSVIIHYAPSVTSTYVIPRLNALSSELFAYAMIRQLLFFTQFGLGPKYEWAIAVVFLLVSGYGACRAIAKRRRRGAYLGLGGLLIPILLLGVFSTTSAMYPRYALFSVAFYALLVAQGAVTISEDLHRYVARATPVLPRWATLVAWSPVISIVGLLGLGAFSYHSPAGHARLSYRPDLRGVANYVSQHASQDDVVVFVGWDDAVSQFYWHDTPPAPVYLASDPALPRHRSSGAVFWIVEGFGYPLPGPIHRYYRDSVVIQLESVGIIRQPDAARDMLASLEEMLRAFEGVEDIDPAALKSLRIVQGTTVQARGDLRTAAEIFRRVPTAEAARTLARAYLPASAGWLRWGGGNRTRAWREATRVRGHHTA
jgi:hypothetical protein